MAKTRERKLEIAQRIKELVCDEHGLEPEALIFDALTFTLTTGDDEWKPSAVETIEGIRLIKSELPGVKTSLGVSNVSFGIGVPARSVLNSVFLHHCVEAGLDLAMVNPNHITPYGEIPDEERKLADDLVFNRSDEALQHFIEHFESKSGEDEAEVADPTADMTPQEALHWHILRRKKDGVEAQIDASVEDIGAVPTLNDVLLPAMKEVGDKFGAGELILPFVLQSAEVMKSAVARLESYLDKLEGYTKGTVVLATVFGDVHDIGKSLVNTILTNNGYTVIDLGKQVPIGTILDAAEEHKATAIGLSALLVIDLQADAAGGRRAARARPRLPGADRRRRHQPQVRPARQLPEGQGLRRDLHARRLLLQGRVRGPRRDGQARRAGEAREQLVDEDPRGRRRSCARPARRKRSSTSTDDSVRSQRPHRRPRPDAAVLGRARARGRPRRGLPAPRHARAVQAPLGRPRRQGRGVAQALAEDFRPRLERMWREQTYLHPRALLGYFPCYSEGNEIVVLDPEDRETELERLVHPAPAPRATASRWPTSSARRTPASSTSIALQAVTAGDEVTEVMAKLEQDGEFAEQLFTHGIGVQTAEGMAEWLHWKIREDLGIPATQGRRYSWGYPAVPEQSEHDKVDRLLGLSDIGIRLSGGHAVEPEQSTLALIAHHPQAGYFGMRNGRLLPDGSPDDVIKGTDRDPSLFGVTA